MTLKGKNILVTGGLGFIGSHIVESLLKQGSNITIYDNYSTGSEENLGSIKSEVKIIKGDILDNNSLTKAMKGQEIISHQAAQLEITRAIDNPIEDLTTNTVGTLNVFHTAARAGIGRIVQASSAGVYGQAITTPQTEDDHPTEPNWAYGVSKLANEKYANIMKDLHGLNITSLRYAIVYGPREWYGRVLTIFLKRALRKKPLIVFGDGEQVRDFVFVKDVVEVHNRCLKQKSADFQIFNVSTMQGTTINELAKTVQKVSETNIEIIHEDVEEGKASKYFSRKRLPMELKVLIQSTDKIKKLLNYTPRTVLSEGLHAEWEWLKENSHRWKKMSY